MMLVSCQQVSLSTNLRVSKNAFQVLKTAVITFLFCFVFLSLQSIEHRLPNKVLAGKTPTDSNPTLQETRIAEECGTNAGSLEPVSDKDTSRRNASVQNLTQCN